jgi:uncharacterized protein (DUF2252 family)
MAKTAKPLNLKRRGEILVGTRNRKMARSAHAYVRGNTVKFYEWLESRTRASLPQGPDVWICGDCHVGNLGPLADKDGHVAVQIRDLDQTVIGNPAHDLIRLGLSLATAGRGSDLPGVTTAQMIEQMVAGYTEALAMSVSKSTVAKRQDEAVGRIVQQAVQRRWRHLAEERIKDARPTIPRSERFWELHKPERGQIADLIATEPVRQLITSLKNRKSSAKVELLDAAYWVKGCSSLGQLRYAVLAGIGKRHTDENGICFLDLKEAGKPAAPRSKTASMPRDNAVRIVTGARALSPNLGERMLAAHIDGKAVVVRELMPQDLKLEIDRLSPAQAVIVARYLAGVVGHAHARQMDAATRRSWRNELQKYRGKNIDAPSWLWTSVVDLVASHEAAYLEHCRKFAVAA